MRSSEAVYQRNLVVKVLNNRFPGREQHQKLPFTTIVHDQCLRRTLLVHASAELSVEKIRNIPVNGTAIPVPLQGRCPVVCSLQILKQLRCSQAMPDTVQ